ncbi:MAG: hypothetical protein ABR497_05415 [Kiritimatiellia bacterium]|nr:hypothetical protein [Lentisphaerota bacterium]
MNLSPIAVLTGLILGTIFLPLVLLPQPVMRGLRAFPRSLWAGRILATIAMFWITWIVMHAGINWVEDHHTLSWLLALAGWLLIILFMDELLAVRALGGILLIAPLPILDAAFMNDGAARLVMTVLAYIMVLQGIALVWSPYLFRQVVERHLTSSGRCRLVGAAGVLLALLLVLLGLLIYR